VLTYAVMADISAWVGVIGAAVGGFLALVGKHFSDMRQKKLDRAWKLEDEDRTRQLLSVGEKERKKTEILQQADNLYLLGLSLLQSNSARDDYRALTILRQWLYEHALWLRSPKVQEFFYKWLSEKFISDLPKLDETAAKRLTLILRLSSAII
jgi:hypothetical protein